MVKSFYPWISALAVGAIIALSIYFSGIGQRREEEAVSVSTGHANLRVYAYSGFAGKWGPGPKLKDGFEKFCNCTVEFLTATDSRTLLQRVLLEGKNEGADVLIGTDHHDRQEVRSNLALKEIALAKVDLNSSVRGLSDDSHFVPFDWGALTINTRKSDSIAKLISLKELELPEYKGVLALEDPRTSSPGLEFLLYVIYLAGSEDKGFELLKKILPAFHSVNRNWSTAYGLFQTQRARSVFSYVTSPIYHEVEEKNFDYVALDLKEGLPVQIEYAAVPNFCEMKGNCKLAERFVNYLLETESQKIIMTSNYMMPVIDKAAQGTLFEKRIEQSKDHFKPVSIPTPTPEEKKRWLQRWNLLVRSQT